MNYLDQDACLSEHDKFLKKYKEKHKYCPICWHEHYASTLLAFMLDLNNPDSYKDENECFCNNCGRKHIIHDRVKGKPDNV